MIGKDLLGYFEYSLNAIFAAEEDKISYMNPAARKLFPNVRVGMDISVLGEGLSAADGNGIFAAMIFDRPCNVTASVMDGVSVYTVYPLDDEECKDNSELIRAVCGSMTEGLSILKMSGELISPYIDAANNEKVIKYSASAHHSLYKLMRLTSNLSRLYGFESGMKKERSFDIAVLVSELTETVAALVEDKGLEISFVGVSKAMNFYGDSKEIERILLNLLSNSIKYSPRGSKINVNLSSNGKRVVLSVADSGRGIGAEVMTDVFRRFDEKKDTLDTAGGAGMGLWIVKTIAEECGGSVMLSSREDQGTVVSVSLPIKESSGTELHTPAAEFGAGGMTTVLTELADVLDSEKYMSKYLD